MPYIPPYDEKALLSRMAAGEADAFATLFGTYQAEVGRFLLRYLKVPELAEDLSQEIFLKIWEGRERIQEVQSFRAYLFVTARNHTLNILQKASRSHAAMGSITQHALAERKRAATTNNAEDHVLTQEYSRYLQAALGTLPPRSREVFRLCREEQKSYEEVARQLGISRNSVKNHMVLSIKILKAGVERDLGIPLSLFLLILYGS